MQFSNNRKIFIVAASNSSHIRLIHFEVNEPKRLSIRGERVKFIWPGVPGSCIPHSPFSVALEAVAEANFGRLSLLCSQPRELLASATNCAHSVQLISRLPGGARLASHRDPVCATPAIMAGGLIQLFSPTATRRRPHTRTRPHQLFIARR
jgi:hypothetical protein